MPRVLVVFAHPVVERSRVNRRLLGALEGIGGVTVHDLYEEYPTFAIDAAREQRLLLDHDAVVFQHPFYWYSVPAILKEWQDIVLEHGWAYGTHGTKLAGKTTLNAISTGGPPDAYRREGYNHFTVRELLAPWEQTARLCGMRFLAPFVVHAALRLDREAAAEPAAAYRRLVIALAEGRLDLEGAQRSQNLRDDLDALLRPAAPEVLA